MCCRLHCQESGEESSETESVYSLKCHISHEVNHLHEGLKHVSNFYNSIIDFVSDFSACFSDTKKIGQRLLYSAYYKFFFLMNGFNFSGLLKGLKGELEKTSPALGRTALYVKESLIDSLPR